MLVKSVNSWYSSTSTRLLAHGDDESDLIRWSLLFVCCHSVKLCAHAAWAVRSQHMTCNVSIHHIYEIRHCGAFVHKSVLEIYCRPTAAVPKLFGCWAKFAILLVSTGRTISCIEKKQKITTPAPSLTFVYCYLLYLLRNTFAMWLMKLILLLHNNSCSI